MSDKIHGSVKQFSYRTALVGDVFLSVPRDTVRVLEEQLAEKAGKRLDNHTAYEIIEHNESKPVYIWFSDTTASFGFTVREGIW